MSRSAAQVDNREENLSAPLRIAFDVYTLRKFGVAQGAYQERLPETMRSRSRSPFEGPADVAEGGVAKPMRGASSDRTTDRAPK